MEFKTHTFHTTILEKHLDLFGHVNNAQYLVLFEDCRWDLIRGYGYDEQYIILHQKGPVILEANIKYKRELKLGDEIKITFQTTSVNGKLMTLHQEMIRADKKVAAIGDYTVGYMDLKLRKLIEPPAEWLKAIS